MIKRFLFFAIITILSYNLTAQGDALNAAEAIRGAQIEKFINSSREMVSEDNLAQYDQIVSTSRAQLINSINDSLLTEFTGQELSDITNFFNTPAGLKFRSRMLQNVALINRLIRDWELELQEKILGM